MKIVKSGNGRNDNAFAGAGRIDVCDEMAAINAFCKRELKPEEVYAFSVLLCDNEVDRDYDRFTIGTLEKLAELFVGVTGISDHDWSSDRQVARIYKTEVARGSVGNVGASLCGVGVSAVNSLGEPYVFLKAYAYMLRTEENAGLIAEIEGGIKRETSVGCSVEKSVCSVCGGAMGECTHVRGEIYGDKLCFAELDGASDAYEWSFVAVPAQRNAGVMKRFEGGRTSDLAEKCSDGELLKFADIGRRYIETLKAETLRLALICDRPLYKALEISGERMGESELLAVKESLEGRVAERLPLVSQLRGASEAVRFDGESYTI